MKTLRLAILLSGSGSTAQAVIRACLSGKLRGMNPVVVVGSRSNAAGLEKARLLGVETRVVSKNLLDLLQKYEVDLVSQNGWLPLTSKDVVEEYRGRLINQHPGPLDPGRSDFGGVGMYGRRVTCARIVYARMIGGDNWTEATTHLVTKDFDKGDVIRIEKLPFALPDSDSPKKLIELTNKVAAELLPLEHKNVISTLESYVTLGKFSKIKRNSALVSPKYEKILRLAKKRAKELFPYG